MVIDGCFLQIDKNFAVDDLLHDWTLVDLAVPNVDDDDHDDPFWVRKRVSVKWLLRQRSCLTLAAGSCLSRFQYGFR